MSLASRGDLGTGSLKIGDSRDTCKNDWIDDRLLKRYSGHRLFVNNFKLRSPLSNLPLLLTHTSRLKSPSHEAR